MQKLALVQAAHNKRVQETKNSWTEADGLLSIKITETERHLGFPIMGNYPLMKFLQQVDDLRYIIQKENEAK